MKKLNTLVVLFGLCTIVLSAQQFMFGNAVMGGINLGNACSYNLNGGYLYGEKMSSSSSYGHHGIDWLSPKGSRVDAMYTGEIVTIATASVDSYYKYIIIKSPHPDYSGVYFYHLYAHLDKNDYYTVGTTVTKGTKIADSGDNNGNIGAHLHTEIRMSSNSYYSVRNPEGLLARSTSGGYGGLYGKVYDSSNDFKQLIRIDDVPKADTYNYEASLTYYRMSNYNRFPDETAYNINYYIGRVSTGSVAMDFDNGYQTVNENVYSNSDHLVTTVTIN